MLVDTIHTTLQLFMARNPYRWRSRWIMRIGINFPLIPGSNPNFPKLCKIFRDGQWKQQANEEFCRAFTKGPKPKSGEAVPTPPQQSRVQCHFVNLVPLSSRSPHPPWRQLHNSTYKKKKNSTTRPKSGVPLPRIRRCPRRSSAWLGSDGRPRSSIWTLRDVGLAANELDLATQELAAPWGLTTD